MASDGGLLAIFANVTQVTSWFQIRANSGQKLNAHGAINVDSIDNENYLTSLVVLVLVLICCCLWKMYRALVGVADRLHVQDMYVQDNIDDDNSDVENDVRVCRSPICLCISNICACVDSICGDDVPIVNLIVAIIYCTLQRVCCILQCICRIMIRVTCLIFGCCCLNYMRACCVSIFRSRASCRGCQSLGGQWLPHRGDSHAAFLSWHFAVCLLCKGTGQEMAWVETCMSALESPQPDDDDILRVPLYKQRVHIAPSFNVGATHIHGAGITGTTFSLLDATELHDFANWSTSLDCSVFRAHRLKLQALGFIAVAWDNGARGIYRVGKEGAYDLKIAPAMSSMRQLQEQLRVTNERLLAIERPTPPITMTSTSSNNRRLFFGIGVSNYSFARLPNALHDLDSIADVFGKLGYSVVVSRDLENIEQFQEYLTLLASKVNEHTSVIVTYFAGHAIDARSDRGIWLLFKSAGSFADTSESHGLSLQSFRDRLIALPSAASAAIVNFQDHCRNHLGTEGQERSGHGTSLVRRRRLDRAMATVWSCAAEATASDGRIDENGGPFARALRQSLMNGRNLTVPELYSELQAAVLSYSRNSSRDMSHQRVSLTLEGDVATRRELFSCIGSSAN